MTLLGNQLFVADIYEIIGFDLTGVRATTRIDLSQIGVSFLNDLVAVSNHKLVVSGTNVKRLFLIDAEAMSSEATSLDFTLNHPNGLEFDSGASELFVAANVQHTISATASNGEILRLDLDIEVRSASLESRAQNAGLFLDGISSFGDDQIIYSDWVSGSGANGVLGRLHIDDMSLASPTPLGLRGFADFHWQESRRIIAAPDLIGGTIRLLHQPIPEPSAIMMALAAATVLAVRPSLRSEVGFSIHRRTNR
jgi:hypothetical protein